MKQCINAEQALQSFRNTALRARAYRGSMVWRMKNGADYFVKVDINANQRGMGSRTPDSERTYAEFWASKRATEAALAVAKSMITDTERVNKALRVGRCSNMVIAILSAIRKANLSDHFMVIGTNALYAYEAQAGVRFEDDLWDFRKTLSLAASTEIKKESLLGVLKKADPTFSLLGDQWCGATNASGYLVYLVKRCPKQFFPNENDFWAAKIHNMDWLISAPKFQQVVIGTNGKFAEMVAPDPRAFVLFKTWMGELDLKQARAVAQLIGNRLPAAFSRVRSVVAPSVCIRGEPGRKTISCSHTLTSSHSARPCVNNY